MSTHLDFSIDRVQVLHFDDFGARLPDGAWKYPNSAALVGASLDAQKKAIVSALSEQAGRTIGFEVHSIPTVYTEPTEVREKVSGDRHRATLILGRDLVGAPLGGRFEIGAQNRYVGGAENTQSRFCDEELAGSFRVGGFRSKYGPEMGGVMAGRAEGLTVSSDWKSAGTYSCNEAFFLALAEGMRQFRKLENGLYEVVAPVGLLHLPGFVAEDQGEERRRDLIQERGELLRSKGLDPNGIVVSSVELLVQNLRNAVLPVLVDWGSRAE